MRFLLLEFASHMALGNFGICFTNLDTFQVGEVADFCTVLVAYLSTNDAFKMVVYNLGIKQNTSSLALTNMVQHVFTSCLLL